VNLTPVEGPAVWEGSRIDLRKEGVRILSSAEIAEIDAALRHLQSIGEADFLRIGSRRSESTAAAGFGQETDPHIGIRS
jgi:hypothetical protein